METWDAIRARRDVRQYTLLSGLANEDGEAVRELQGRFFAALFPALDKLQVFAGKATPRERARMFEPATGVGA